MADQNQTEQLWKPAANPWLIAAAVMLATFMEVLDTSVANVSLNYIAGSLAVSNDEATWVLTSYLVSNAVILPASGWLSRAFGRKRFLITCIAIFTVASVLCGLANSLGFLILARILQGAGGGALQPVAQAVMLETFPREKRGVAMSVYAMGVVVAPILGPTLGGWLTDNYSWRWVFYINLPIGILAILMCLRFLEDPPLPEKCESRENRLFWNRVPRPLGRLLASHARQRSGRRLVFIQFYSLVSNPGSHRFHPFPCTGTENA